MEPDRELEHAPILAIVGPTATGKTAAAVCLARALNGEIISADSGAVYRGLDIGTAKPTREEQAAVPFHVIDVAEPDEQFTVARFKELAERALEQTRARGRRPLVVGGTGLYVRVLLEDYGLTATAADPKLRASLDAEASAHGAPFLHARLNVTDPEAASRIHPNDRVRIIRALEVIHRTGRKISDQQADDARRRGRRAASVFAFTLSREELYSRIDARVDAMVKAGIVEEVKGLLSRGITPSAGSLGSLGYKEVVTYLNAECSLEDAIALIKRNTRRLAKRQLTWFRSERNVTWLDVGGMCAEEAAEAVLARLAD